MSCDVPAAADTDETPTMTFIGSFSFELSP